MPSIACLGNAKPAENYILELIETLPQLDGLEKSFHSFYVCTAVRKFFFFLDPLRAGRIRIQDVLACSFLDDLLELRSDIIIIFYYLSVSKYTFCVMEKKLVITECFQKASYKTANGV